MCGELVALEDLVEITEVSPVEGHHGLRFKYGFVLVEVVAGWQGPEETSEPLQIPTLLQHLADACDLLLRKAKGGQD